MKPIHVPYLAASCVLAMFLVVAGWEFVLEDRMPFFVDALHGHEFQAERWEYVITATAAVALVAGILSLIAFRAISQRSCPGHFVDNLGTLFIH